ncbi:unnamed protein product [Caenorhabditis bovis]|uniref:CYtochrome P450 family n=1 Tax=Caenorhabditis bovis TaxID=2654633 RepID=A0A8S1E781_9PELO|nr:unnamed protein product [Caenorhabditis bovis]
MAVLILLLTLILLWLVYELNWKRRNLPPGPTPFPLIGNLYRMFTCKAPGLECYQEWRNQYGDVYTVWMGPEPVVVIAGYQKLKETFLMDGDSYKDKKIFSSFNNALRGGDYGVIDTNGEIWREHRRFALHTLRDFGLGKELMENKILLEVEQLISEMKNTPNDLDIQNLFDISVGNIINQFLFGAPDFLECRDGIFEYINKEINAHKMNIDYSLEESKDFTEAYLKEQKRKEANGDLISFSDIQLKNVCFDMWIAGMHTTMNTLGFLAAYAIQNPQKQKKVHDELDRVIGNRLITMQDRPSLPYTTAFINESQRMANLLPLNLVHATTRDVNIDGYRIPKGTAVVHQISSVLSDPKIFPNPDEFQPERYLDDLGNLKKIEELISFSIGKRVCLGEGLARTELFLFTANMLNNFELLPNSDGIPSKHVDFSFIVKQADFKCNARNRFIDDSNK